MTMMLIANDPINYWSDSGAPNFVGAVEYVSQFYRLMIDELEQADYTPEEMELMEDPVYYYGRYLNPVTRSYFEETVIPVIGRSALWLGDEQVECVLDLGCGLAMQSIIFAALGKRVVAVDLRPESIELSKKRKEYYEKLLGRELSIDLIVGDFRKIDLSQYAGRIDGVFSMSAFSYIHPLDETVALIDSLCSPQARVFLFEENASNIAARVFRRRQVPKPTLVVDQFVQHGFSKRSLSGTCAMPKQFWVYPAANGCIRQIDEVLRRSLQLAFSYALQMERQAS